MTVRLTHDAATAAFDSASGAITVDDGELTLDDSDTHVVTVEAPDAIADAFETDKFYKTENVTTARPIKQQYVRDGEVKTYVKPAEELKKSAWTFDNRPFTIEHPDAGIIHDVDDVRGFWRNPSYDDKNERLSEDLYIPATDGAAQSFVAEYGDVSVGFFDETTDDYNGDVGSLVDDTDDVDGYQTNIYGNHIAAVRQGRCSGADGCGLDGSPHGSVIDTDAAVSDMSIDAEDYDTTIPEAAQSAARNFLDAVDEGKVSEDAGGPDGLGRRRAQEFADGGELSMEVWVTGGTSAVANWHARHAGNEEYDSGEVDSPWEDNGYAMFKAWGGSAARDKAMSLKSQHESNSDAIAPMLKEGTMVEWVANTDMTGRIVHVPLDQNIYMVELYDNNGPTGYTLTAGYMDVQPVHNETMDDSTSFGTQQQMTQTTDMATGDWVTWENGAAHGKVDEIVSDGCTSRGKGDMEVCADGDDPAVVVEVYDDETGESKDELVRHMGSTLNSWSGPTADNATTDAPDGLYQDDEGNWYGVAPAETVDDEPKYDLNNCNDVKDAWNLRGSGDYNIDQSTLEARIKRAADAHDCPPENRPWEPENDNRFTIPMSDNAFDIPDLALDTLADKHDAVDAVIDERDEMAESLDEIRTELDEHGYEVAEDECPCDTVDDVLHTVDEKDEKIDNLEDTLSEYRADERDEKLKELVETYNADRENFEDADLEELKAEIDRRAEIAEDLGMSVKQSEPTTNDGATNDGGSEQTGTERTFGRGYGN